MAELIYHWHHIVPKHVGGTDDPKNVIKLTVEEHANAHKELYQKHNRYEDYIAWKALSGQIKYADIQLEKSRLGGIIASQKNIGSKRTAEQRLNMSKAKCGYKRSLESRLKQSQAVAGEKNHFYGKTHTDEFKKAQSERKKKLYIGKGNPNSKSIEYNNVIYDTMKDMEKITQISLYNIRKMIKNNEVKVV